MSEKGCSLDRYPEDWQVKEVIDPDELTTSASECIIEMVYNYVLSNVWYTIMTNYTWSDESILKLLPFYESFDGKLQEKMTKFQLLCENSTFVEITEKYGLLELPIYSKSVNSSKIVPESSSRVYHNAAEYLDNGSATEAELHRFVSSVLKEVLKPIFSSKEIRNVTKDLIKTLVESSKREDQLRLNIKTDLTYDLAKSIRKLDPGFPGFHENVMKSITNFIGYFALHTIRHHCFVNFGVDGELKFYQREMRKKALEDKQSVKIKGNTKIKSEISVKKESISVKEESGTTVVRAKAENKDNDSDSDFCEIIESPKKKSKKRKFSETATEPKIRLNSESNSKESKDFPEKYLLEDLDKDPLPMTFKTKFRKLVERNQMLRDEISDYKDLIQIKIAEKKKLL